jgi:hypothetical protein
MEQQNLGVSFPTITRLGCLTGFAGFDDHNIAIGRSVSIIKGTV